MSGGHQTTENLPGAKTQEGADRGAADQPNGDMSDEARARRLGWYPKDQYRGDAKNWVDAKEFLRRGEEQQPILRENIRKLDARAARLEAQVQRNATEQAAMAQQVSDARQAVLDIREMMTTTEERAYQRAIKDIEARMDAAIEEGDAAGAKRARADLSAVTEEMAKRTKPAAAKTDGKDAAPAAPQVKPDPDAQAWVDDPSNAWYRSNPRMRGFADGVFDEMKTNPKTRNLSMAERLERVRKEVVTTFPDEFDDTDPDLEPPARERTREREDEPEPPRRRATSRVQEPRGPTTPTGGAKRFEDMPKEAQDQFSRVAREIDAAIKQQGRGRPLTKEQFAADYFGGDAKQKED